MNACFISVWINCTVIPHSRVSLVKANTPPSAQKCRKAGSGSGSGGENDADADDDDDADGDDDCGGERGGCNDGMLNSAEFDRWWHQRNSHISKD